MTKIILRVETSGHIEYKPKPATFDSQRTLSFFFPSISIKKSAICKKPSRVSNPYYELRPAPSTFSEYNDGTPDKYTLIEIMYDFEPEELIGITRRQIKLSDNYEGWERWKIVDITII